MQSYRDKRKSDKKDKYKKVGETRMSPKYAQKIKTNNQIKGYKITPTIEKKIVAYADDTTLILTDPKSIKESVDTINSYCKASGAEINKDKTEILITGPWKLKDIREVLTWIKEEVKILGSYTPGKIWEKGHIKNSR